MLQKVDTLVLSHHFYLNAEDECYFGGEYTARKGYAHSPTNQLISNLKMPVSFANEYRYRYKRIAMNSIAKDIVDNMNDAFLKTAVFVPIPPSKAVGHPEYDNRITLILQKAAAIAQTRDISLTFKETIRQTVSTDADHLKVKKRLTPEERYRLYEFDDSQSFPEPESIVIFDDLLTTGSHFKAMELKLRERYKHANIFGLFVARRVPECEFDDDFEVEL